MAPPLNSDLGIAVEEQNGQRTGVAHDGTSRTSGTSRTGGATAARVEGATELRAGAWISKTTEADGRRDALVPCGKVRNRPSAMA